MTPNPAQVKGTTRGPVLSIEVLTGWFAGPWFDPYFAADDSNDEFIAVPQPSSVRGFTPGPAIVQISGAVKIMPTPGRARGITTVLSVSLTSLTLAPQRAAGRGITGSPHIILASLVIVPLASSGKSTTTGPAIAMAGGYHLVLSPARGVSKAEGPMVMSNSHDTRSLGSISTSGGLYFGADSSGNHKLTGALDYVRILKGRAISVDEAQGHRDIILGNKNGSAYPEVGHALGQFWAFYRLAQYYFVSNDPGARAILENWLAWLDAYGAPDGSGWKFPTYFSEYGFTYGAYDPGAAASLALGCLYTYLRGGQASAAVWARRILDDLRLHRQSTEFGGGYKSDYHYAWLNALVIQAFGLAAHGLKGEAYHFPSIPEDTAHFTGLMDWLFGHAGDAKPNLLNADLLPFTLLEDMDVWDYAPNYVFVARMGSTEALVLMLGAALAHGQGTGDWVWFERLWRFMLADNLISLDANRLRTLSAGYQLAGVKNLVRVYYADYDQDNSRYLEARDDQAVAAWGEAATDMDFRYGSPVILEDPEVAQLIATRLLKRLSSPWEVVDLDTWLEGARLEIGDTLAVTSPFHGFTQEEFTVFGKSVDLEAKRVSLNLARPFINTWAWAVDSAGSSYDACAIDQDNNLDADWANRAYAG
jgi:hypothetical protein